MVTDYAWSFGAQNRWGYWDHLLGYSAGEWTQADHQLPVASQLGCLTQCNGGWVIMLSNGDEPLALAGGVRGVWVSNGE